MDKNKVKIEDSDKHVICFSLWGSFIFLFVVIFYLFAVVDLNNSLIQRDNIIEHLTGVTFDSYEDYLKYENRGIKNEI